jgi:Ca2+:H+ antiporter
VGGATEQLGSRVGSSVAGVIQSGLGNLPELFIALFALHQGLNEVVQFALVGSVIANSVFVLGIAFIAGGIRNGTQRFDSPRARMIATLTALAAVILAVPSLAHEFTRRRLPTRIPEPHLRRRPDRAVPPDAAGFPHRWRGSDHAARRWTLVTTIAVLGCAGVAAAFVSDWFVSALQPATDALGMSEAFAGLVVVAIAGNAI